MLGGEQAGVSIEVIRTQGDARLDIPLQKQLDKGFFTAEIERALLDGRIDVAVHSLKDLPTELPPGLALAAVPPRADAGDVLVVHPDALDATRPLRVCQGGRVGTSALRRLAQLEVTMPDAQTGLFRGNVPTRVGKVRDRSVDAAVLARAGLARLALDLGELVAFDLIETRWLPAPGQGALGLEIRADDEATRARIDTLHDAQTAEDVGAERGLLARMEGGCHTAFAALGRGDRLRAAMPVGGVEGAPWHVVEVRAPTLAARVDLAEAALREGPSAAATVEQREDAPWVQPARAWA